MPKQRVKAQHYVPRTYLRFFSNDKGQIWTFDKQSGDSFLTAIENVAQEGYFYESGEDDPNVPGQRIYPEEQPVEEMFSKVVESPYREVAEDIIANAKSGLDKAHMPFLAKYLTAQLLRTREAREQHVQTAQAIELLNMHVNMQNAFPHEDHSGIAPLLPPIDEIEVHLRVLLDSDLWRAMEQTLLGHTWLLGVCEAGRLFQTSDHPVAMQGNSTDSTHSGTGVGSKGVEIYLPISPSVVLVVFGYPPGATEGWHLSSRSFSEDGVIFANDLQTSFSYRQVYASQNDFDLAKRRITETPWSANPKRRRLEVSGGPFGNSKYNLN